VSLSIVVSNASPSRTAMMAMPWRPSGPLTNTHGYGRTGEEGRTHINVRSDGRQQ
jgi:hypothetical protein